MNPTNYHANLPGKMCALVQNNGMAVIGGNQPLSDWIWGLLHKREYMSDSVNPVNKQTQEMARKVIGPKEEIIIVISQTGMAPDFFLNIDFYTHRQMLLSVFIRGVSPCNE